MLHAFKRYRRKLLSENRIKRYLLYAIGEIILVVIGILIALQINTLNQERIDRDFEVTMLREIRSALISDLETVKFLKFRLESKGNKIQTMLSMIASNQYYPDSVLLEVYNQMIVGNIYSYNRGAYEAIKSVGIDKITNDSLRNELIKLYEVDLPAIESFYEIVIDEDSRNKEYRLELHNQLWKRVVIQMPDSTFKIVSEPINQANFLKQSALIDRIKIEQDNLNFRLFRLPHLSQLLQSRLDLINEELGSKAD